MTYSQPKPHFVLAELVGFLSTLLLSVWILTILLEYKIKETSQPPWYNYSYLQKETPPLKFHSWRKMLLLLLVFVSVITSSSSDQSMQSSSKNGFPSLCRLLLWHNLHCVAGSHWVADGQFPGPGKRAAPKRSSSGFYFPRRFTPSLIFEITWLRFNWFCV